MSNQMKDETAASAAKGRRPALEAYNVTEGKDGKGFFNKVGAAWEHKDGQGYDLRLDSIPVDGHVTLRELRDERVQDLDDQRQAQHAEQAPAQSQEIKQGHEQER